MATHFDVMASMIPPDLKVCVLLSQRLFNREHSPEVFQKFQNRPKFRQLINQAFFLLIFDFNFKLFKLTEEAL